MSVCVLCGSPVWPSPPVVGLLRCPPLCVGPLWVGSSPVVFPFPVESVPVSSVCIYIYVFIYPSIDLSR